MSTIHLLLSFALAVTLAAAVLDLRSGQIPNWLTLAAALIGGVLQIVALCTWDRAPGQPLGAALVALAAARVGFAVLACGLVPYLLFLRDGMGGGDVKLLGAVGALLGPVLGLEVELYAFVGMALFACGCLAYQGRLLQALGSSATLLVNPMLPKQRRRAIAPELLSSFKFGPAVFAGVAIASLLHWRSA